MSQLTLPFTGFSKIARLSREIVVTEKIDGTNGQINIQPISFEEERTDPTVLLLKEVGNATLALRAGSKSRFLTRKTDNFGFCKWVEENAEELFAGLGEGQHFGEWWGSGIQRGYGLRDGEKRFSLFNSGRWIDSHLPVSPDRQSCLIGGKAEIAPKCCHVVPVLWEGVFSQHEIEASLQILKDHGSAAAPGFMKPEGVIVYHTAARIMFKKTIEKDESPKGRVS